MLETIRELGRATAEEVSDETGLYGRTAGRVLNELVGSGLERSGKGVKGDRHVFEAAA